MHSCYKTIYVI